MTDWSSPARRLRVLAQVLIPLLLVLPLAYATRSLFWTPLDRRFYDVILAETPVPLWEHVLVVGIDRQTRRDVLTPPANPISRHAHLHATVIRRLAAAGARAIVLDFTLSEDEVAGPDSALVAAIAETDICHLVAYLEETVQVGRSGGVMSVQTIRRPIPALVAASRGAYLADVQLDEDGVLRRFHPNLAARELGVVSLPEQLAGKILSHAIPIGFPSLAQPLPQISFADVVRNDAQALASVAGRLVFIGQVEDPLGDFITVPTPQRFGAGLVAEGLPGVSALATITETILQNGRMRHAGNREVLAWILLWSVLTVGLLMHRSPLRGVLILLLLIATALSAMAVLQVRTGVILPFGFTLGSMLMCGTYSLIGAHVATAKKLHIDEVEMQRVQLEMESARRTQEALLPRELPTVKDWGIWAINVSSLEVSGDYYDFLATGDGRHLWLIIADVSGKGMPASLIMSNVHAGLHGRIRGGVADPGEIATDLSSFLLDHTAPERFVTAIIARLELDSGDLVYVSAGHDAPLVRTHDDRWIEGEIAGPPLGIMPDFVYRSSTCRLARGDTLCLYTDGITEAEDEAGQMYGSERLRTAIAINALSPAPGLGEAILSDVAAFRGRASQTDDITLLVVKSAARS